MLERPSEEDARRVGASPAKDKGKGKAVLDGSGSDTGLEVSFLFLCFMSGNT